MQQLSTSIFALQPACADLVLYYWSKVVQATNGPPEYIAGMIQLCSRRLIIEKFTSIDSNNAVFPVRFILQAMILFKESLGQWAPVRKNGIESERGESQALLCPDAVTETYSQPVLSKEFVENAVRLLVTRFIPLNPNDLEAWMSDPEEWINAESDERWEFELRVSCQNIAWVL